MFGDGSGRPWAAPGTPGDPATDPPTRKRARWGVPFVLSLAVACASLGCSLLLDFDGTIEEEADASVPDAGPPAQCLALEPNDMIEAAQHIDPGTRQLAICPGSDQDFLSFDLGSGADMVLSITFDDAAGKADLNLRLYSASTGLVVDTAMGSGDDERIERSDPRGNQLTAGTYVIEVYASGDQPPEQIDYNLSLEVSGGVPLPDAGPAADASPGDGGL
jgi:hypothetical protein